VDPPGKAARRSQVNQAYFSAGKGLHITTFVEGRALQERRMHLSRKGRLSRHAIRQAMHFRLHLRHGKTMIAKGKAFHQAGIGHIISIAPSIPRERPRPRGAVSSRCGGYRLSLPEWMRG